MKIQSRNNAVAEIIAIGNELLIGKTQNTNTTWLIRELTELGVYVKRTTTIRDSIEDIVEAIKNSMKNATFVVTTGGLGPTHDDITLEGVSKALDLDLKINEEAFEMVKKRYEFFYNNGLIDSQTVTPERKKMAIIPKTSTPIFNQVGVAPGVILQKNNTQFLILPGVPNEMKSIFRNSIDNFKDNIGKLEKLEIMEVITNFNDESKLAPMIKKIQKNVPYVLLKSVATCFGTEVKMKVRIVSWSGTKKQKDERIKTVLKSMENDFGIKYIKE